MRSHTPEEEKQIEEQEKKTFKRSPMENKDYMKEAEKLLNNSVIKPKIKDYNNFYTGVNASAKVLAEKLREIDELKSDLNVSINETISAVNIGLKCMERLFKAE